MITATDTARITFETLVARLRTWGFRGEVRLSAGLLIVGCFDKNSAGMVRRGFRRANLLGGLVTEVRSATGAAFVWLDTAAQAMPKAALRAAALAA